MWEFSLNINPENFEVAKYFYNTLFPYLSSFNGLITSHEQGDCISVLLAVEEEKKLEVESFVASTIVEIICNKFKEAYLNDHLLLPKHDKIGMSAFKKALLNFDKETDRFIVKKNLSLKNNLYLESFYKFRLQLLQDKWAELVSLSNENREYLVSDESFVDLLKFLVDNLDICTEEVSVFKEEGGYRIYDDNSACQEGLISEEIMISSVIDLSPQRLNLYFNESSGAINLLARIFEERVTINKESYKNVKKFKLI